MRASFLDAQGKVTEVDLAPSIYQEAHEAALTVPQFLNNKYPTDPEKYGSAFDQISASLGLFVQGDKAYGLRAPSMKDVMDGNASINAGVITRDAQPASRIIFPAVFLELVESSLVKDYATQPAIFDKMVALDSVIAGARFEQPVMNLSRPQSTRSQGISQMSLPAAMLSITIADVARRIPTFSLGLELSDEAARASTIDLVAMAVTRQVAFERDKRVEEYLSAFLLGDADMGSAALVSVASATLDPIATGGVFTQLAWIKFLYRNFRYRRIDYVACDLATAMKIENRTGKPTNFTDDPNSPRITSNTKLVNSAINDTVKIFLLEDGVIAAGTVLALDSRYAIRRVRNSEAEYQAVEQFVLKRSSAMRFDFGEVAYRMFDLAFDVLTMS